MDINDLHDLRDGASPRRHRTFNPFIHIAVDSPLMQMLFTITRPGTAHANRPERKRVVRKKVVHSGGPTSAMVEWHHKPKPE